METCRADTLSRDKGLEAQSPRKSYVAPARKEPARVALWQQQCPCTERDAGLSKALCPEHRPLTGSIN